ncbi:MAG: zinc-binding alcohol dehydrogenase family protein, partial [Burkholderia sp.]|nr:zinc-binding alcohol dehydrogenase family protein [Burkholderia sp.]
MRSIRFDTPAADIESLDARVREIDSPVPAGDQMLIEVRAAGVNPSDV